ncbi:MAG: glycosyl hydrolase-related protein [Acidipropionibacterium sp.]|jgi:alpha-mannosidase|nr:glycosyl hydrolase-related protein [Acidipropionibacterium sp.]
MMERQRRVHDLEGSPRVTMESPDEFFATARAEYPDAPVWVGELYLELHRGTFTSHAREKRANRRAEHLLREAELWWTLAAVRGADYPYDHLDALWRQTLLQQFHDILPGSSISWVHQQNETDYQRSLGELENLIDAGLNAAGIGNTVLNAADQPRTGLITDASGDTMLVSVPGLGYAPLQPLRPEHPAHAEQRSDSSVVLDNGLIRVTIDRRGLITSILDLRADREVIPAGRVANLLQLHQDLPNAWDAWDIDAHYRHTRRDLTEIESIELADAGPLHTAVTVNRAFGNSSLVQTICLNADDPSVHLRVDLDWHEDEKLLKVSMPFRVHALEHSAEIAFGHLRRASHTNTSWDDARFEVVAHRWIQVEEPGYGVAVTNAGSYGHEVTRSIGDNGEVETEIRISLVRAARCPDPIQDIGQHVFEYSIIPGAGIGEAIAGGYDQNLPLRRHRADSQHSGSKPMSLLTSSNDAVRIEAVKLADDRSGDVIVRVYESLGGHASTVITPGFIISEVTEVGLTEHPLSDTMPHALSVEQHGQSVSLSLRPFQIITLRLHRP